MWYNMSAEKNGKPERIQETAENLAVEEMEKSFPVVKRSEILRFLLTFFCKEFENGRRKSETWKIKVPHEDVRASERKKARPKK